MSPEQAGDLVAYLVAKYPRAKLTAENVRAYQDGVMDLDYEAGVRAVRRISNESKWFPSIAEIREAALSAQLELPAPEEAWCEVVRAIDAVGSSGWPAWSCPEIAQAVKAVNWHAICMSQLDQLGMKQAHFMRCYGTYVERTKRTLNRASAEGSLSAWVPLSLPSMEQP